jgi:hypothetical protein
MNMGLGFCALKTLRERLIKVVFSAFLLPGRDLVAVLTHKAQHLHLDCADRPGSWQRHTYPPTSESHQLPLIPTSPRILLLVDLQLF